MKEPRFTLSLDYGAERILVDADTPDEAVLVLGDLFHPFWIARLDGNPVAMFPIFHIMRGVAVPRGRHLIEFECRVPGLHGAVCLSIGIVLAGLGATVFAVRRRATFTKRTMP